MDDALIASTGWRPTYLASPRCAGLVDGKTHYLPDPLRRATIYRPLLPTIERLARRCDAILIVSHISAKRSSITTHGEVTARGTQETTSRACSTPLLATCNAFIMRFSLCAALLGSAAVATASEYSARPQINPSPKQPRLAVPDPPERTKFCTVKTHGNGSDDSAYILSAFHECNNGGHVLFSENTTYTIGTAMDWTFLEHIDIGE